NQQTAHQRADAAVSINHRNPRRGPLLTMHLFWPDLEIVAIAGGKAGACGMPGGGGSLLHANVMTPVLFIGICGLCGCLYLALLLSRNRRMLDDLRSRLQESHDSEARMSGRLHVLEHSAPDAVLSISSEGFIEDFNRAAERLFGYSRAEIANHHFRELFPEPESGECHLHSVIQGN